MKLRLRRIALRDTYTIGKLEVLSFGEWKYICDTLEDKVRDLSKEAKVYGETAIPYGTYEIAMNVVSPKFSNAAKYPKYVKYGGKLPRLLKVKGFEGILIHIGNDSSASHGCILLGENKQKGKVLNSTKCFYNLMDNYLLPAYNRGEEITITIE